MKPAAVRRAYMREAFLLLALAWLAVHLVSAARVRALASRPPRRISRFAAGRETGRVTDAVDRIAAKRWMPATCLSRALAAQVMLRRRGVPSRLCLGVARADDALAAHAWIEIAQGATVGADEAQRYTRIAEFG